MTAVAHLVSTGILAAGDAPNAHVTFRVLITYFQTDPPAIAADVLLGVVAVTYLAGVERLRRRGRSWSAWSAASFLSGLLLIFVAIGSGLAAYDGLDLSAHMVQHMLLMMTAPPLLALGRPVTLLAQAASRPVQVRVLKVVNSKALQVVSGPLSWVVYYGSMWVFFLTPVYAFSGNHPLFHDATHLFFVAIGYLFWQGIIGLDAARHRMSHAVRLAGLFIGMPVEAFLGIAIMSMSRPIAPGYTVGGTHTGGATLWVTSMFVMASAIIVAVGQWVSSEERKATRIDAVFDRHAQLGEPQISEEDLAKLRAMLAPGRPTATGGELRRVAGRRGQGGSRVRGGGAQASE